MRKIVVGMATVALLAATAAASFAESFGQPEDLVEAIYDQYESDEYLDYDVLYSERLGGLYDEAMSEVEEGEMGPLDFDPFINAQDYDVSNVEIGKAVSEGDRTKITVTFDNFGESMVADFFLVEEDSGWKLDDFHMNTKDGGYNLSEIFTGFEG